MEDKGLERPPLEAEVIRLAILRQNRVNVEVQVAECKEELARSMLGIRLATMQNTLREIEAEETACAQRVRQAAVELYTARGVADKKVIEGVNIRVTTRLEYDEAAVIEWCARHALALQEVYGTSFLLTVLDRKAFEAKARDMKAPVTEVSEPMATIARDLSGWLREPGVESS